MEIFRGCGDDKTDQAPKDAIDGGRKESGGPPKGGGGGNGNGIVPVAIGASLRGENQRDRTRHATK